MENFCKSQFGQDINVIENIYKHKENGYFVEVGAYDGLYMSNTYLLEYKYKWKGICVECNPIHFNNLIQNRPNCNNCKYAVYSEDDQIMNFINDNDGGCSGFVNTNSHTHTNSHTQLV